MYADDIVILKSVLLIIAAVMVPLILVYLIAGKANKKKLEIAGMAVSAIGFAVTFFSFLYDDIDFALFMRRKDYYEGTELVNLRLALFNELADENPTFFILFAACVAVEITLILLSALNIDMRRNAKAGIIISAVLFVLMIIVTGGDTIAGEGLEIFVIALLWLISMTVETVLFLICFFTRKKTVKIIGLSLFNIAAIFMCFACYDFFSGEEYLFTISAFATVYIFTFLQLLAPDEEYPRELLIKEKAVRVLATVLCAAIITSLSVSLLITDKNIEYKKYFYKEDRAQVSVIQY